MGLVPMKQALLINELKQVALKKLENTDYATTWRIYRSVRSWTATPTAIG